MLKFYKKCTKMYHRNTVLNESFSYKIKTNWNFPKNKGVIAFARNVSLLTILITKITHLYTSLILEFSCKSG